MHFCTRQACTQQACARQVRFPALSAALLALLLALLTALTGCGGGGGSGGGGGGGTTGTGNVTLTGMVEDATTGNPPASGTFAVNGSSTALNADGTFTLAKVAQSATTATITAASEQTATLALSLPKSTTTTTTVALGTIYLEPKSSSSGYTATASGTVVTGTQNTPVGGASVTINGSTVLTATNGTFSISNLPVDLGTIAGTPIGAVSAAGYVTTPIYTQYQFVTGTNNLLGNIPIQLGSSTTAPSTPYDITGTVTSGGAPKAGATVVITLPATSTSAQTPITTTTNTNGNYFFWVGAGTYPLVVYGSTGQAIPPNPSTVTVTSTDQIVTVPTIVYQ